MKLKLKGPAFDIANFRAVTLDGKPVGRMAIYRPRHGWGGMRSTYSFLPSEEGVHLGLKSVDGYTVRETLAKAEAMLVRS